MLLYALSYQIFWCIIHHILIFNFAICANLCHKVMHHMHAQTGKCITPQLLLVAGFDSNLCRRRASPYSCPMPILTAWGCVHEPSMLFIEERNERRGPAKSPGMVLMCEELYGGIPLGVLVSFIPSQQKWSGELSSLHILYTDLNTY